MGIFESKELEFIENEPGLIESAVYDEEAWKRLRDRLTGPLYHLNNPSLFKIIIGLTKLTDKGFTLLVNLKPAIYDNPGNKRMMKRILFKTKVPHFPVIYESRWYDEDNDQVKSDEAIKEKVVDELRWVVGDYHFINDIVKDLKVEYVSLY